MLMSVNLLKNMVESFKAVVKNIKGVLATMWDNIPLEGWQKNLIAFVAAAGPMLLLVGKLTLGVSKGIFYVCRLFQRKLNY